MLFVGQTSEGMGSIFIPVYRCGRTEAREKVVRSLVTFRFSQATSSRQGISLGRCRCFHRWFGHRHTGALEIGCGKLFLGAIEREFSLGLLSGVMRS